MTYSITMSAKSDGDMVHNVHWKGNLDPIAVCRDFRDAQRICDALNAVEAAGNVCPASLSGMAMKNPDVMLVKHKEQWNWVRVEDRLPDKKCDVLVYTTFGEMIPMEFDPDGGGWLQRGFSYRRTECITHWCYPVPPSDQLIPASPGTQPSTKQNGGN